LGVEGLRGFSCLGVDGLESSKLKAESSKFFSARSFTKGYVIIFNEIKNKSLFGEPVPTRREGLRGM